MNFQTFNVRLDGQTPLLLHADDVEWADTMEAWRSEPENVKLKRAGDDRTPAWTWLGCCYHDGVQVGVAADNLMTMLREGGAKVPTGKRGQTFKRQSQSGLLVNEVLWPIITAKGPVSWAACAALKDEASYQAHEAAVAKLGFSLFAKRARIGQSKHVRVRPRFDRWSIAGTITVLDPTITEKVLRDILQLGGIYCGLGDWRPSSPSKPGVFGKFSAQVEEV